MKGQPLTWYPGTILPYASLWHTLARATWLNDLRPGDIRSRVEGKRPEEAEQPHAHRGERDARALASALGEPLGALSQFAVIEQFPAMVRAVYMVHGLRWCPACVAGGFHTLLGSIQLVTRCPIHAAQLIDACPQCADGFKMRFGGLAVRPQPCRCGRTRLLEPRSARQPCLGADDVAVWAPVARWVRDVGEVTRSASPNSGLAPQIELALTSRWCCDLGIEYPRCFDDESSLWPDGQERARWSSYEAHSGNLNAAAASERPDTGSSWPATWQSRVYRAMGRHLRRHGLVQPDRWIMLLMDALDPAAFAVTMAARPTARAAFTEMLWARHLEPRVEARRWRRRPAPAGIEPDTALVRTTPIELHKGLERIALGGPPVSVQARLWMAYHAMAVEARRAWGRAWRQTQKSITDGWADWSIEEWEPREPSPPGGVVWFCRSRGPRLQFTGYVRDAADASFSVAKPTKQQRGDARADARLARLRRMESLAGQPCLGWCHRNGWRVEQGARPDDDDLRRVALLHSGQRSACWVFKSGDHFVARLADGVIQVSGATAREALCGLRQAVVQYRRTYGAGHALKPTQPKQIDSPRPAQAAASLRFRLVAARVGGSDGGSDSARFWAAGPTARGFRPTRADPGAAERDALGARGPLG